MKNSETKKHWDIFCHVIDNYGDAGVCWRLAQQLAHEFDRTVRLWIDDLAVLKKFQPEVDLQCAQQIVAGVDVWHWSPALPSSIVAADVVIEAFACELPQTYRAAMRARHSLWINLEYLSAESWVSDCHGLPSPQKEVALKKYFFFPGFRANTGGVLGERDLPQRRRAFQNDTHAATAFLQRFASPLPPHALRVSLFAYRNAPIEPLLKTWAAQTTPVICFVPAGQPLAAVGRFFGEELAAGDMRVDAALTVVALPFLSQNDYDQLLWSCDLNCVRGEDSFVRAQWAGLPFIWQIYAQEDGAHWPKLDAFMELYDAELTPAAATALRDVWRAWNGEGDITAAWSGFAAVLPELKTAAERWSQRLESGTNLAAALVQFCANQV